MEISHKVSSTGLWGRPLGSVLATAFGPKPAALEELLKESDVISIHVPLTKETKHLVGRNELALVKKSVVLVNE